MSIYTKRGDKGITDMARTRNISKSDDRIRLSGAIDELNSHIGLMISMISSQETVRIRYSPLRFDYCFIIETPFFDMM